SVRRAAWRSGPARRRMGTMTTEEHERQAQAAARPPEPAVLRNEVWLVLALSLLASAVFSLLTLFEAPLKGRTVTLFANVGLLRRAARSALLEEVIVVGYLLRRLDQLGWRPNKALAASALLRGSYHLYQGFGGFVGNVALGVLFGRIYQRQGRTAPLVAAHFL